MVCQALAAEQGVGQVRSLEAQDISGGIFSVLPAIGINVHAAAPS